MPLAHGTVRYLPRQRLRCNYCHGREAAADTAKLLDVAVSGRPEDIDRCAGEDLIEKPLRPLVILPGLSGTGYEMSRYAFFDGRSYSSHFLMPHLAVIDARIAITEDILTTSASILLALTHAVEAFSSAGEICLSAPMPMRRSS